MATLNASRTATLDRHDWLYAELVMRTWSDPALDTDNHTDPFAALAAFGATLHGRPEDSMAYAGLTDGLVIEDLDHAAPVSAAFTFCG
jgi:hypothetical protein